MIRLQGKKSWLGIIPSQLTRPHANRCLMMAMMILVVPVNPVTAVAAVVVRPATVVTAIIRRPSVITVITTRVIPISRVSVAVTIGGITDPDSSDSD
jgi:hypothetical protein